MDEDLEKRAIEAMPVVSSLRFHAADAKNKSGYHVNLRCGCGAPRAKQVGAMCAVVVSKTSCKDRNHRILRGVIAPHQEFFFFCKNHDFSRFLINFSTVVVVKHTHVVDPKRLTHIHSHRDLNSLSLSTESTYLLVPMP